MRSREIGVNINFSLLYNVNTDLLMMAWRRRVRHRDIERPGPVLPCLAIVGTLKRLLSLFHEDPVIEDD